MAPKPIQPNENASKLGTKSRRRTTPDRRSNRVEKSRGVNRVGHHGDAFLGCRWVTIAAKLRNERAQTHDRGIRSQKSIKGSLVSEDCFDQLKKIDESHQSRSVILHGNVYDLFPSNGQYVPLMHALIDQSAVQGKLRVIYELNSSIRILAHDDTLPDFAANSKQPETRGQQILREAWVSWKLGKSANDQAIAEMLSVGKKSAAN